MSTYRAEPDFAEDLRRAGITDYESAMTFAGGILAAAHRGRSVVRLPGGLHLKRFVRRARESRRELRAMEVLRAGPGPEPAPLAARGEGGRGAFHVTAVPERTRPLPVALSVLSGEDRRRLVRALGESIRALHDRGYTCPDLLAHHLLVGLPDRIHLIDAGRLARRRGVRARARDLAALSLSLPFGVARDTDRVRFLAAYLREKPRRNHPLLRAAVRAYRRLDRRGRHRRDRLVADPAARERLAALGIRTFDDLLACRVPGAVRLRVLPDRENWRIEQGGRVYFVKRHRPVKGFAKTPAAAEWEAIRLFRRAGLRVMRPVAFGEDVEKGSVIWVERAPGEPLDDLLRRRRVPDRIRRELVREAGAILGRMRRRDLHHRDFYACHLFADLSAPPGGRLTLIDLQRARRRPRLRERWTVKDAAALLYSAPRPPVTRTDLVRFLRACFAVEKLGPREKRFARRAARKAARIARRRRKPRRR